MTHLISAVVAVGTSATVASAGGLERSTFNSALLFEDGDYAELSFGAVSPSVSGVLSPPGVPSGSMLDSYVSFGLGYKRQINDRWSYALILDQPIGANTAYPVGTPYPFSGATAEVTSLAVTGLVKYTTPQNLSFYGGIKAEQLAGDVAIPFFGYTLSTNNDLEFGYVVGAAWEKPDIAARVALTYSSEITHAFDSVENGFPTPGFDTTVPASLQLDLQTAIAADTLLFGSVRWVDWSAFDITPPGFGGVLAGYDSD